MKLIADCGSKISRCIDSTKSHLMNQSKRGVNRQDEGDGPSCHAVREAFGSSLNVDTTNVAIKT